MSNSSRRLSRGDRRRNDRLARLRAVITRQTAVLAFDLAADKQVCALTDQDSRVLARRTVKAAPSDPSLIEARHVGGHSWVAYGWNDRA